MRRIWFLIILASLLAIVLFITLYFRTNSMGEPELKIGFNPNPPWHIRPGETLELNLTITNEGKSAAKNVTASLTVPTGFTITQTGTNVYSRNFNKLEAGEKQNETVSIIISTAIISGNYTLTVKIFADNIPEESYNYQMTVELPHIP